MALAWRISRAVPFVGHSLRVAYSGYILNREATTYLSRDFVRTITNRMRPLALRLLQEGRRLCTGAAFRC